MNGATDRNPAPLRILAALIFTAAAADFIAFFALTTNPLHNEDGTHSSSEQTGCPADADADRAARYGDRDIEVLAPTELCQWVEKQWRYQPSL